MSNWKYSLILLSLCLSFASCDTPPHKPKTPSEARLNIDDEPQSLDPRKARSFASGTILRMLFDGLTRLDAEEKAQMAVAEKVDISKDGKIYTFTLRKSQWNNGDPVTAEDFAYAWKKVLDPVFPADYAYQMYVIKNAKECKKGECPVADLGIHVINEYTLQVELESPVPYFLDLLAFPVFFPVNKQCDLATSNWAENAKTYVSNGPFQMEQWRHHDEIDLIKNPSYWDASTVRLERIQMTMVQENTALQMYERDELDWAGSPLSSLPSDTLPDLKDGGNLKFKPMLGTYFFRTNIERAPLNNPLIRKALALAINRKEIVEHVLHGQQISATGLVPPSMSLSETPFFEDGNVQEARRLFEEGLNQEGWTVAALPELVLTFASSDRNKSIAQAVQQQWWQGLGIPVRLEAIESKVYFSRVSKQDFQLAAGSWIADFNDPINFLEVFKFKQASTNNTHWENAKYIELLDESGRTLDVEMRRDILRESEKILIESMPIIPLFHYTMLYLQNEGIKDIVISSLGVMDFKHAYREDLSSKPIAKVKSQKELKQGDFR